MKQSAWNGGFVEESGETWYRIDFGTEPAAPFFMTLAGDSDLWAFISTAGSLTAGRRDQDQAFFPYETVDKIHARWEHTGPRTWIRAELSSGLVVWEPFAPHESGRRSVWKNLSGTRIRFRDEHPSGQLAFEYEWAGSAELGLVRTARLSMPKGPVKARVLDGVLNLIPPGITFNHSSTMSSLTDAYKWNEAAAGGRMGLYTLYAKIWDRAEPKESFEALTAWHCGLTNATTLLSAAQVDAFVRTGTVEAETLTRGRRGAFLVAFDAPAPAEWFLVLDGPKSQVQAFELTHKLLEQTPETIRAALKANDAGVDELLAKADGFQTSGDPMAAAHHRANVLFNIMRGGVFVDGTQFDRDDLIAFAKKRNKKLGDALGRGAAAWPAKVDRSFALEAARATWGPQAERLVYEYLPLTFSRRHGDPSRPWNRFSIQVRNNGRRVVNYQGNWRDIFQNWEGLIPSEPAYIGSMITAFLGAMTVDGYNPYRVSRDGIDWEVVEHDNPWSNIGYWGDHQVVYLLKLLEAARDRDPGLLATLWDRALFTFGDVPYRLKPHAAQTAQPKSTITFDHEADRVARERAAKLGADGLLVPDHAGDPILATLGEKLAVILVAKAASLVPGGGLWLHTQRPEWNDANNALVGSGLSVVTLGYLRRFLVFLKDSPETGRPFPVSQATLKAVEGLTVLAASSLAAVNDEPKRRAFVDASGALLEAWREQGYRGSKGRIMVEAPAGLLTKLVEALLPLVDATLDACRAGDLFHSYNLIDFSKGGAAVGHLYPMLEGQVAVLSSGYLSLAESSKLLGALYDSPLYTAGRNTFLLYPDRALPGFFDRNRLDEAALALPVTKSLLDKNRTDLLQKQCDGTVRFAPQLSNRLDLEAAGADVGSDLAPLGEAYDRLLRHHEFTGRSGTMFGYEGLGCVYWHMVAKLLLAVQERVWEAHDQASPELETLKQYYFRVRDGLGYRKAASDYGAFPADPYSHTPGEGGAQQPGMTGQVKEEVLTRWGELGLRVRGGLVTFQPVLLEAKEIPEGGELSFTWARVPYTYRRGASTKLRVKLPSGWKDCPELTFDPAGVLAVEAEVHFQRG